jgi:hypothetical protein
MGLTTPGAIQSSKKGELEAHSRDLERYIQAFEHQHHEMLCGSEEKQSKQPSRRLAEDSRRPSTATRTKAGACNSEQKQQEVGKATEIDADGEFAYRPEKFAATLAAAQCASCRKCGDSLLPTPSDSWYLCEGCGYRPASWSSATKPPPCACCPTCKSKLCCECQGIEEPSSPEHTSLIVLRELAKDARADPNALLPNASFTVAGTVELHAFVVGPVIRQIVSQGALQVCGGAATAGALNACTEQLCPRKQLHLSWQEVLFGHFQDKLRVNVKDENGNPASWKVGKTHIRRTMESFPNMKTRDLITWEEAMPDCRKDAWRALLGELRQPHTAVFFHTKGREGHYALIAGAVGPSRPSKHTKLYSAQDIEYDPVHSAILTNQLTQEPIQRVSFERTCELIRNSKGFFQIFVVQYKVR